MKSVFKVINGELHQKILEEGEKIPDGWSEDVVQDESSTPLSVKEILELQSEKIEAQSKAIEDLALMIAQGGVE